LSDTDVLEHQEKQRTEAKRASFELLKNKKRQQQEFTLKVNGDEFTFLFEAVSAKVWDDLVTRHKPTMEQKAEQMSYNPETFAPALMSRVCIDPVMNESEWREIWTSDEYSKGELSELFWSAFGLCNRGLDVNPIGTVSG
jgi:hypothetical protein